MRSYSRPRSADPRATVSVTPLAGPGGRGAAVVAANSALPTSPLDVAAGLLEVRKVTAVHFAMRLPTAREMAGLAAEGGRLA
jgi:hypothetical protein